MQIRPARVADVAPIDAIVQGAYGVYVERIGRRPAPMDDNYAEKLREADVFVAEDDGVIGVIVLVRHPNQLLIENVAVDQSRQGRGVGRALLDYAETHARTHQLYTLRLYTNAVMTENLAVYHRLGYREDERRGEGGFKRVFLSKRLDAQEASDAPPSPRA